MDTGPVTYDGGGHKFARGEAKILIEPNDILYFEKQPHFSVEYLEGEPPVVAKTAKTAPRAELAAVKGGAKKKTPKTAPPPPDDPVDGRLTAETLEELTPKAIAELIDTMGYEVPEGADKAALIKLALDAQDAG
jgi:hypothetical protein